jgi:hypothetical protein
MCAGFLLLVPVDQLTWYALVSLVTGVPMATVIAAQSLLIARYASREELAESFTWATTCLLAGVSSGIAIGGALAEVMPAYWLLIAAAGVTALAAVEVLLAIES